MDVFDVDVVTSIWMIRTSRAEDPLPTCHAGVAPYLTYLKLLLAPSCLTFVGIVLIVGVTTLFADTFGSRAS